VQPAASSSLLEPVADGVFPRVAEWRIAYIVGKTTRLHDHAEVGRRTPFGETVAQHFTYTHAERAANTADFQRMGQAGMDMVVAGYRVHLCLAPEPAEGARKNDPVVILVKRASTKFFSALNRLSQPFTIKQRMPIQRGYLLVATASGLACRAAQASCCSGAFLVIAVMKAGAYSRSSLPNHIGLEPLPGLLTQLTIEPIDRQSQARDLAVFTKARPETSERSGRCQHQRPLGIAPSGGPAIAHDVLDALQGMRERLPVVENLLTMHFHAQPNQILTHGQVAGCAQGETHGSKRS